MILFMHHHPIRVCLVLIAVFLIPVLLISEPMI